MTDQNLTEIICIVDRSGSMESVQTEAINGFNTFLAEQKKLPGKATMTYVQFDDQYELVHNGKPIQDVPPLTADTFQPRGWTALLDAIGKTLKDVGIRLGKTPEEQRPGKVIVVILTDGQENKSTEYNNHQIKTMIEHQTKKYSWQFIYLGANQNAFAVGQMMGIQAAACASYIGDSKGTSRAYKGISNAVSSYRTTGSVGDIKTGDDNN
jgi:uncharacterized protein YegL